MSRARFRFLPSAISENGKLIFTYNYQLFSTPYIDQVILPETCLSIGLPKQAEISLIRGWMRKIEATILLRYCQTIQSSKITATWGTNNKIKINLLPEMNRLDSQSHKKR